MVCATALGATIATAKVIATTIAKSIVSRPTRTFINARARRRSESWRIIRFSLNPKKWRSPDPNRGLRPGPLTPCRQARLLSVV